MSNNAYGAVIADLKAKRDNLNKMIADLEAMASGGISSTNHQSDDTPLEQQKAGDGVNDFLGKSIPEATLILLTQQRRKMRTKEISKALEDGGMEFSGANVTNTIGSVLNRRQSKVGDIVSPDRGYWGLKEWYPGRTFGKKAKEEESNSAASEPSPQRMMPGVVPLRTSEQT